MNQYQNPVFKMIFIFLTLSFILQCSIKNSDIKFISGADISSLPEIESHGGQFYQNGVKKDLLDILKLHGCNYIRLRLWHSPSNEFNNLDNVIKMAKRAKANDFRWLLDFHYSDTWADPGKQFKPNAWKELSFSILKDSVYYYTRNVINRLKIQNVLPDMIQVGNEIDAGMLWDDGKVEGDFDTDKQWFNFSELLKAGIRGVRSSLDEGDLIPIMIHVAHGGDNSVCRYFYDRITSSYVPFDIIGISYYPWFKKFCGTLDDLNKNINDLSERYDKDIIVVETAYAWTLEGIDNMRNRVRNQEQLHEGFPPSVEGQYKFLKTLKEIVRNVKNGRGKGFFYWEPDHISTSSQESFRENLALFDFQGEVLNSMKAFEIDK